MDMTAESPNASQPLFERPEVHARRWFLLGVMCLSLVLVVMSVSSLNVAVPTIQTDLEASPSAVQWILDSYVLVFAGLLLAAGALGDRFGRREALLGGLGVFGVGCLVSGLATDTSMIIVGRAVQGVGAAFIMPATLSIVAAIFPPDERGKAIAIWVGFASAGGAIGQVTSGALLEAFWWGSTILVNVPIVAIVAVVIARFAPRSRDEMVTPLDPIGAVLSLASAVALLFGIIEGPVRGWTDPLVVVAFGAAVVVGATFVWWERRVEHPMLPLDLFGDLRFSVGAGAVMLTFFAMVGFWFLSSQYLQFGRGYSPLLAGVVILPMAATAGLLSPRSDAIATRIGAGATMTIGFVTMAAGFVTLALISQSSPWLVVVVASCVLAGGMALVSAPATTSIMTAVPIHRAGVGSAVNDVTREFGSALGIAVLGSVVNSVYRSRIDLGEAGVPPDAARTVEESIGAAAGVAAQAGDAGRSVLDAAAGAFTEAFNAASAVSAAAMIAAAVAVAGLTRRLRGVSARR